MTPRPPTFRVVAFTPAVRPPWRTPGLAEKIRKLAAIDAGAATSLEQRIADLETACGRLIAATVDDLLKKHSGKGRQ